MAEKKKQRKRSKTPQKENETPKSTFVEGIPAGDRVQDIKIDRLDFDYTELEFRVDHKIKDLVEDISKNGQQFPVILRPIEHSRSYQIISGFRRCRAIKELGWETIKAIIRNDVDDDKAYRISFLENEKQKNYTGVDKANAIAKLRIKEKTDAEICEIYGIGQRQLDRYKRVSTFPEELKTPISNEELATTHGLALMRAHDAHGDKVNLTEWVARIVNEELSVRKLTRLLNAQYSKPKKTKRYLEKKKGGGFRIYPMQFDPQKTPDNTRDVMIQRLEEAIQILKKDR